MESSQIEFAVRAVLEVARKHAKDSRLGKTAELNVCLLAAHDILTSMATAASVSGDRLGTDKLAICAAQIRMIAKELIAEV